MPLLNRIGNQVGVERGTVTIGTYRQPAPISTTKNIVIGWATSIYGVSNFSTWHRATGSAYGYSLSNGSVENPIRTSYSYPCVMPTYLTSDQGLTYNWLVFD